MLRTRFFEIADDQGIRYTRLAAKMGYSPEYLSRVKHGREPITEEFQRRACAVFANVPPSELFFVSSDDSGHHSMTEEKIEVRA